MPLAARGVVFAENRTAGRAHPNRADIVCFVGFTSARPQAELPAFVRNQLEESGWWNGTYARPEARQLIDVPVTVTSWEQFDALFAWDRRPVVETGEQTATWLGAAVRSFFSEGGRQCVIVAVGDPWPYGEWFEAGQAGLFQERIDRLIPGYPFMLDTSPAETRSWRGIGHLAGLPEVSFVSLPDLPELCAGFPDRPPEDLPLDSSGDQWVECSTPPRQPTPSTMYRHPAPRSDAAGYQRWSLALSFLIQYLARYRRDVQAVASLPLPLASERITNLFHFLVQDEGPLSAKLASAFLQLSYPWLKTRGSSDLPESAEPPEGTLAGQLARNALVNGTFRSLVRVAPHAVTALSPVLTRKDQLDLLGRHCFLDRVSLYGNTPRGIRLLSDVTTSLGAGYRAAAVNRLVSVLIRAARAAGDDSVFDNSGPELWEQIEGNIGGLMQQFWEAGALGGTNPSEAYSVRCDRTTMTQNDIDSGRLIAEVRFVAAYPLEQVTVTLELGEGSTARRSAA